jgi:hypothetical protein
MNCLDQLRQLYTEFTGQEIAQAIAQVRAELIAQHAHENSTESVITYKYNPTIQEEIGPVTIPKAQPKKRTKATTELDE